MKLDGYVVELKEYGDEWVEGDSFVLLKAWLVIKKGQEKMAAYKESEVVRIQRQGQPDPEPTRSWWGRLTHWMQEA